MKFDSATLNPVNFPTNCCLFACLAAAGLAVCGVFADAQDSSGNAETGEIRIVAIEGSVEIMSAGAKTWVLTQTNQMLYPGDELRTGDNSRVTILWSDKSVVPLGPLTQIEILAPDNSGSLPGFNFVKGVLSFFHRDKPGRIRVLTHGADASIEGTEFVLRTSGINGSQQDTLSVIDGKVLLRNSEGSLLLTNDQQGVIEPGKAPVRTAGFIANNILQWCFYYPAVLDPGDLPLTRDEQRLLGPSLEAYRAGNLLVALAKYPELRRPESDSERIYHAALLLSVGEAEETESALEGLSATGQTNRIVRLASALRTLIAAVKRQPEPSLSEPELPTEFLAASYYEQSRAKGDVSLSAALGMARQAAALSPEFGFAWERVAELEFSFGRVRESETALDKSLALSPQNAQALVLKGFLLASKNRIGDATTWFDRAIATDGALGNAWLGRGLCRIRRGDRSGGLHDLLIAAATEPQRSLLRSYLAKGYSNARQDRLASREIAIAMRLDPSDPTAWLYSALLKQQENRINGAVSDMEKSQSLNDNRQLFRSKMLLDQDNAVRSANLAQIYQDAGMNQVSVDEATRAVNYDYANYSAHLFLAESDNALRDPTRFDLRYETAWFNELLLANLYAPVGASAISQNISEQEYSPLLAEEGLGLNSDSQYRSDGEFHQIASQYGNFGRTSYSLDLDYQHNDGIRPNNDLSDIEWYSRFKQQLSSRDAVMLFTEYESYHTGDNFQYNNEANASPTYRYNEYQSPTVAVAWHHESGPGIHTLLLAGRLEDQNNLSDQFTTVQPLGSYVLVPNSEGTYNYTVQHLSNVNYWGAFTVYSVELNQLIQSDKNTLILGTRYQLGPFTTHNDINYYLPVVYTPVSATITEDFQRFSAYGYDSYELLPGLLFTLGVTYDNMTYPDNFRFYPITPGQTTREQLSPKAGVTWDVSPGVTLRAAYAQALGGASFDESYTLEPSQIAGFNQSFRSIISESLVGPLAGPKYSVLGGGADLKFKSHTYITLQGQLLTCDENQDIGVLYFPNAAVTTTPGAAPERLRYHEPSASVSINQLAGQDWAFGGAYRFTYSKLDWSFPTIVPPSPPPTVPSLDQTENAQLHEWDAYIQFTHPSGFYASAGVQWYLQYNSGHNPNNFDLPYPENNFAQVNLFAGYRFWQRRGDITFGILNIGGGNYSLNPLNVLNELPRSRVFMGRVNLQF